MEKRRCPTCSWTPTALPPRRTTPSGRRRKGVRPWSRQIARALWAPEAAMCAALSARERLDALVHTTSVATVPLWLARRPGHLSADPALRHAIAERRWRRAPELLELLVDRAGAGSGQNPYWTPYLYAPYGAPLYLHTLNLFNGVREPAVRMGVRAVPAVQHRCLPLVHAGRVLRLSARRGGERQSAWPGLSVASSTPSARTT